MNVVVLGTSNDTASTALSLLACGCNISALVSMPTDTRPQNSLDICSFARANQINYLEVSDINDPSFIEVLRCLTPDYIFCLWPKLLGKEILNLPKYFCIGSHPTELPHNRGRHPLHWLLSLGIEKSCLSFFRMDEGVDSGNILLQLPFTIPPDIDIGNLERHVDGLYGDGAQQLVSLLRVTPDMLGQPQDHTKASYWRKRTLHDVTLDPRMPACDALNVIRSYCHPYPGAGLRFEDGLVRIHTATIPEHEHHLTKNEIKRIPPGTVVAAWEGGIIIKFSDRLVELQPNDKLPESLCLKKHLHPPGHYINRN